MYNDGTWLRSTSEAGRPECRQCNDVYYVNVRVCMNECYPHVKKRGNSE